MNSCARQRRCRSMVRAGPVLASTLVLATATAIGIALAAGPAFAASSAAPSAPRSSLPFDEALRIAAADAPAVSAAQARIDAARHEVVPAGELPDPKLVVGIDNLPIGGADRFAIDRDPMTAQRIGLMQEIPNRAKRDARLALAQARLGRSRDERAVVSATARREAAVAWIRRYGVERQLDAFGALFDENRLLESAVRARIAAGTAMTTDAVMPRQEAAMLVERRDALVAAREQSIAALRRWVGAAAELPLAGEPPNLAISRASLTHRLHRHPELAVFDAMGQVADAQTREAESMKSPDWGVEVAYQRRGRQFGDMVMLQLSFDLPLFAAQRQDPAIAARRAERAAIDAEREAVRREHLQRLESDLADHERLGRALERSRRVLLPLAAEKVELALTGYRGGRLALSEVIAARRERVDAALAQIGLEAEQMQVAARLRYAADGPDDAEVRR